ncbi:hypothetical protein P5P86_11820 [Nocardioides sp. BP30]|uniref:hypothetical protein n=1 Tax=Nocardioides sp. BP30 TaxID=3036374 RepID=UPI0024686193|nr:hypothetical protein [Nocardioides sp. BP30]WGL50652.1 hypothetical protein P5P86_11820 [Nocardioides sp. BP30]
MADANGRHMAQNYDPETGIAIMNACAPNCRYPCTPICPLDPAIETSAVFGPAGLDFTPDDWTRWTHDPEYAQPSTSTSGGQS